MVFIIYKTTNIIDNKFYIGKHKQEGLEFDGYLGSGTYLLNAVKKHGKNNFLRQTLFVFENEKQCFLKEEEIIQKYLKDKNCYNIKSGGHGGFEHLNSNPEMREYVSAMASKKNKGKNLRANSPMSYEERQKISERNKKNKELGLANWSEKAKEKHRQAISKRDFKLTSSFGEKNSGFGAKHYINLETFEKKKFYRTELVPDGWVPSVEYFESKKETSWFNDGIKNYR
jgi:hypothetical protein